MIPVLCPADTPHHCLNELNPAGSGPALSMTVQLALTDMILKVAVAQFNIFHILLSSVAAAISAAGSALAPAIAVIGAIAAILALLANAVIVAGIRKTRIRRVNQEGERSQQPASSSKRGHKKGSDPFLAHALGTDLLHVQDLRVYLYRGHLVGA